MTTERLEVFRCALCSEESEHTTIGSTNAVGHPDLDARPPQMRRSTIFAWVQRCLACGYCAAEITSPCATAPSVVASNAYKRQLNDAAFPVLANSFLCKAMLDRETGDLASATWAHIHAAWACDDAKQEVLASNCRKEAAKLLVLAESKGQRISDQRGLSTAILVDLLRRAGEQEKARQVLARPLKTKAANVITKILKFQAELLDRHDLDCHTVAEALVPIKIQPHR